MIQNLRNPKFYLILGLDIILFSLALLSAYLVRFDFYIPEKHWNDFLTVLPIVVIFKTTLFTCFGLYKGMWRYTDLRDSWRLAQASILAEVMIIALLAWLFRFQGFSRGVFVIDTVLTFLFTGGVRVAIRTYFLKKDHFNIRTIWRKDLNRKLSNPSRCLIVGAGSTGEKVLREIIENPDLLYEAVGFLDDDKTKVGKTLHGVPVLNTINSLPQEVRRGKITQVLIAIPSASGPQMRRVVELCEQAGVEFKTMPGISELINGRISLSLFREVNLEDLLGRKQVELSFESISSYLTGKVVLTTGAGGSIGSELIRQIVRFKPETIILIERGESALYNIQMELKHELGFQNYVTILGSVQDQRLMDQVFNQYRPQVIFHAAAYKHVPMLERNPWDAVFNNVVGSKVVMETALRWEAERFVLVSTDKAVRPTNVMGASKRITELIMQTMPQDRTKFMSVRFGNVLGSAGSVIPLFQRQIKRGGPLTVTHPEITRYFMTISEACQLIVQAGGMGQGGEIFVLKMGQPIRIVDMARDLIRLSGKEPDVDIEIQFTGLRPGEKLYEELITQDEGVIETEHKDILVLRPELDPHAPKENLQPRLQDLLDDLCKAALILDGEGIKNRLQKIVPEYSVAEGENVVQAVSEQQIKKQLVV